MRKKGNTYIQITLTPFHMKKLEMIGKRTGLKKSGVLQRMIENYTLLGGPTKPIDGEIEKPAS